VTVGTSALTLCQAGGNEALGGGDNQDDPFCSQSTRWIWRGGTWDVNSSLVHQLGVQLINPPCEGFRFCSLSHLLKCCQELGELTAVCSSVTALSVPWQLPACLGEGLGEDTHEMDFHLQQIFTVIAGNAHLCIKPHERATYSKKTEKTVAVGGYC